MKTSIDLDRFLGFPINSFIVEQRRSLTVHLEDAGMYDVFAPADANCEWPVFAGRFKTFRCASTLCDKLNAIWRLAPQSTAAEIVAFVSREPVAAEVLDEPEHDPRGDLAGNIGEREDHFRDDGSAIV